MTAERLSTYTRCTSCRRLMLWCVSAVNGKRVPLEPEPHPDGIVVITNLPNGTIRGRFLTGVELPAQAPAHRLHSRICPAQAAPAAGPKCGACLGPLDPWLVDEGYTRHIGCLASPAAPLTFPAPRAAEPPAPPVHEQDALFPQDGTA